MKKLSNRPIFTKRDWPSFKAAITWNDQIEKDPLLENSGYYDIIAGTNATGTGAVSPTGATAGNGFDGEPDVLGAPAQTSAEKFAAAYGIDPVRVQAALTPQMGYAEYLKRTGMAGVSQKQYDATVRSAEADYAKGKATYGQKAETLGQRGLTGSGYGDYLTGASFAAMQNAKVAAADTKALTDAETARGYGEYLTGVQQANAQAAAQAANANAVAEAEAKAQTDAAYNTAVSEVKSLINENVANEISDDQIKALVQQQYGDIFDGDLDSWLSSAHTAIDPELAKAEAEKIAAETKANEEKIAADTANIKTMIADYIAQKIDDKGIEWRIQLEYGHAYDGSLSQWINESRTALQGDTETVNTENQNRANLAVKQYFAPDENGNLASVGDVRSAMLTDGYTEEQIDAAMAQYSKDFLAQQIANINLKGITLNDIPTNDQIDNEITLGRLTEADAATLKADAMNKRNELLVNKVENEVNTPEEETAFFAQIDEMRANGEISTKTYKGLYKQRLEANLETLLDSGEEPLVALADLDTFINSIANNVSGGLAAYLKGELANKMDVDIDVKFDKKALLEFAVKASKGTLSASPLYTEMEITVNGKTEEIKLITTSVISKKALDALGEGADGDVKVYSNMLYCNIKGTWAAVTIPSNFVLGNMNIGGKDRAKALYDLLVYKYR